MPGEEALRFNIFAKDEFSKSFNKLTSKLPSVKTAALAAAGGVAALGTALFAIAKTTATAYDKLGKFSDQTGISTEFLSKMGVAANFADVNVKTMNKSLEYLQVKIGEAAKGIGEGRETLESFGIALHKDNGILKTTEDMLPELADKFQAMTSATERTEAAQKLFGQRGIAMIKILKDGSEGLKDYSDEAEAMGLVVSEQAAANAAEFNDALFRVTGTLTGLKNEIGEKVMPYITALSNKFSSFVKDNRNNIIDFGYTVFQVMNSIVEKTAYGVGIIIDSWRGLQMTYEVIKIGLNEMVKFMVKSIDFIIEKMTGLMEAINFRGVFDEEIARAEGWSDSMKMGIETLQESADAARDNLQKLVSEGMATQKIDQFIEKTHLAIESIREAGEAEVETTIEKNEELEYQNQLHNDLMWNITKRKIDDETKYSMTAKEAQMKSLQKIYSIGKTLGKEFFRISQLAGIGHAIMSAHEAAAKALAQAPIPWNFALSKITLLAGYAEAAAIGAQKYAAHGGMTNVPSEQTMLLDKGERILSPNQNKDFTDFISGEGGACGGVVIENINILPNATNAEMLLDMRQDDWEEIVENNIRPALNTLSDRGFAVA